MTVFDLDSFIGSQAFYSYYLYYSLDGNNWYKSNDVFQNENYYYNSTLFYNIFFLNNMWFATGIISSIFYLNNEPDIKKSKFTNMLYSYNGINWFPTINPFISLSGNISLSVFDIPVNIISNNNVFVTTWVSFELNSRFRKQISISYDGIQWIYPTVCPLSYATSSNCYGNGVFLVSGKFENNKYLVYSTSYDADIWSSFDIDPWENIILPEKPIFVSFQKNLFISYLKNTNIIQYWDGSPNSSWSSVVISSLTTIDDILYNNGVWVVIGYGGIARATSVDGPWTSVASFKSYGNGIWVVICSRINSIVYSTDNALTWNALPNNPFDEINNISFDGSVWIATGQDINKKGIVARSVDFFNWNIVSNNPNSTFPQDAVYNAIQSSRPGSVGTLKAHLGSG